MAAIQVKHAQNEHNSKKIKPKTEKLSWTLEKMLIKEAFKE